MGKTLDQFRAITARPELKAPHRLRRVAELDRALNAAWWFIENVTAADPDCTDIFFELREIVREARGAEPSTARF